jgi:hypothetical protein
MKTFQKLLLIVLAETASTAFAGVQTGVIQTLHVNVESGRAYLQFVGLPTLDGGAGCTGIWTGNLLTDDLFMKYIWPLLIAAKVSGTAVTIALNGCTQGFPKIIAVDLEPRAG